MFGVRVCVRVRVHVCVRVRVCVCACVCVYAREPPTPALFALSCAEGRVSPLTSGKTKPKDTNPPKVN